MKTSTIWNLPKIGPKVSDYFKLEKATYVVFEEISRRKEEWQNHLALKLSDPMSNAKTYWLLLKTFYNGKKVRIIPPLLIDSKIISEFEAKAILSILFLHLNVCL